MPSAKPFFESTARQDTSARLLLVSYHFPPGSSAGALRWEKLSRFAVERGWGLDVITLDPAAQPNLDWQRLRSLAGDIRVFGVSESNLWVESFEHAIWRVYHRFQPDRPGPFTLALSGAHAAARDGAGRVKFGSWPPRGLADLIRGYYASLEYAHFGRWAADATRLAREIIRPGIHAAVITCGPPHMAHTSGATIADATGLPFIMDLRDPWSLVERLPESISSELSLRLARRHEARCVRAATIVALNTELARREMQDAYPEIRSRCITVMNGCDDDPIPPPQHDSRFLVVYAGTIYLDRDPRFLFRACARLVDEFGLGPTDFGLEFIGDSTSFQGDTLEELARRERLDPAFISTVPFLSRSELMQRLSRAAMLLNLPQDSHLAIPSKVFEYLRFHAWLLLLEHEGSATELLLRNSGADVVCPDDVESISRVLRMRYSQFASGIRPEPLAGRLQLSRRSQAEILLTAIDSIVLDSAAGGNFELCWRGSSTVGAVPDENRLNNVGAGDLGVQRVPFRKSRRKSRIIHLPRYADLWFPGYVRSRLNNWTLPPPGRVWVAIADCWEPYWVKACDETARQRAAVWYEHWPKIAQRHVDSAGRPPQYTFYYPEEEYCPAFLELLADLTRRGIADVEVHIHHDREGKQNFIDRMSGFIEALVTRHGLLRKHNGRTVFGFIHGNSALANSLPGGKWCGLDDEITILRDLGCYADFTMPSANSPSQSRLVNTIYWVTDNPLRPRPYDRGVPVKPGAPGSGDLLLIPGPLGLRWTERLIPRIELGEIAYQDLPTRYRVQRWLDLAPRIGNNIFIKLSTHGAQERNSTALLLNGALDKLFEILPQQCQRMGHELHYVTTWEMRQAVDAAAGHKPGNAAQSARGRL